MRGQTPFIYDAPALGLRADVPVHKVPQGALISGQNMFLDIDGFYKPRFGYGAWSAATGAPGQPLQGFLWYTDIDGSYQYVGGSAGFFYAVVGGAWTQVGSGLNGVTADQVRIVDFDQPYMGTNTTP